MTDRRLGMSGAGLVLVAPFLPWMHVVLVGDVSLVDVSLSAPQDPEHWVLWLGLSAVPMGAALIALVASSQSTPHARDATMAAGLVAAAGYGFALYAAMSVVSEARGFAFVRPGPLVGMSGALLMVGAAWRRSGTIPD